MRINWPELLWLIGYWLCSHLLLCATVNTLNKSVQRFNFHHKFWYCVLLRTDYNVCNIHISVFIFSFVSTEWVAWSWRLYFSHFSSRCVYINIYISLLSVKHTIYSIMQSYNRGATCFDRLWSSSGPIFELVQVI